MFICWRRVTAAATAPVIQQYLIFVVIKYCADIELLFYYIGVTIMFKTSVYVVIDILIDIRRQYLHILAELYPVTRKSEWQKARESALWVEAT